MAFGDYGIFPDTAAGGNIPTGAFGMKLVMPSLTSGTDSNYIQRRKLWTRSVREFTVNSANMSNTARQEIIAFLLDKGIGVDAFLYRDPFCYQMADVAFGTGDNNHQAFQLKFSQVYSTLIYTQNATFIKPDSETVKIDGTPTALYSLDDETGIVTFDAAPGEGAALTASFHFYFKVVLTSEPSFDSRSAVASSAEFVMREVIE